MNADKSKEVVFNSNGKQFLNTFKCAKCTLETVNSYCYLGVTFNHNGSLTHTSKLLMEKAKKHCSSSTILLDLTIHVVF